MTGRHSFLLGGSACLADLLRIEDGRARILVVEGEGPLARKKPTFSKVSLDCVEIMTPFEITYDVFEDNIVGENLEELDHGDDVLYVSPGADRRLPFAVPPQPTFSAGSAVP